MRVLIVGGGGREHALAWSIRRGDPKREVICAPGNGGTAREAENAAIAADDVDRLTTFARERRVDLVVVGPEAPLVAGLADRLREASIPVFGPSASAAALEGSKVFAKRFLRRHGIPTAAFEVFDDAGAAREHVRKRSEPMVVKADGLAAGKGVYVCATRAEAERAVDEVMVRKAHGAAGDLAIVEDCLAGEEASLLVVTDGRRFVPLAAAQDHKRVGDGDTGDNTGGMGAYAPAPVLTRALRDRVLERIIEPTVAGMAAEGRPFAGCLYAGLMIVQGDPYVLEYNVRFGDPEAQPILHLLASDPAPLLEAAARGALGLGDEPRWREGAACCVVMAQRGYPGRYDKGAAVSGVEEAERLEGVVVFHAGTRRLSDGSLVVSGGRVLGVSALGEDLADARDRAYEGVERIGWDGAFWRKDIAARGLERAAAG